MAQVSWDMVKVGVSYKLPNGDLMGKYVRTRWEASNQWERYPIMTFKKDGSEYDYNPESDTMFLPADIDPNTGRPYSNYLEADATILYANIRDGTSILTNGGSFRVVKGNYRNVTAYTKIKVILLGFDDDIQTITGADIKAINIDPGLGYFRGGSKQPRKGSTSKCTSTGKKVTFTKDGKKVTRVVHENQRGTKVVKYNDTWILLSKLKI